MTKRAIFQNESGMARKQAHYSVFPCQIMIAGRSINSAVGSILPSGMQKKVLESIFALGRAQLSPPLLNEKNPVGSARLARLKSIFDEGKSIQVQFHVEDLGFSCCLLDYHQPMSQWFEVFTKNKSRVSVFQNHLPHKLSGSFRRDL